MSDKTKREWMERACLRKKGYNYQRLALGAIRSMGKEDELHSYICVVCGKWHIGHIVPRELRLGR